MKLVAWVRVARQSILTVENFYRILALGAELRNIFWSAEDVYSTFAIHMFVKMKVTLLH